MIRGIFVCLIPTYIGIMLIVIARQGLQSNTGVDWTIAWVLIGMSMFLILLGPAVWIFTTIAEKKQTRMEES